MLATVAVVRLLVLPFLNMLVVTALVRVSVQRHVQVMLHKCRLHTPAPAPVCHHFHSGTTLTCMVPWWCCSLPRYQQPKHCWEPEHRLLDRRIAVRLASLLAQDSA